MQKNLETIENIQREYLKSSDPWYIGFSGGKDSSAVLKLVYIALINIYRPKKPITVIYCDTGVEIPIVRSLAIKTLKGVKKEANNNDLPIQIKIATPPIYDRFFVKVIGRGYPSPTNKFRWCTDRLRINPVKSIVNLDKKENVVVLLGTRNGESYERDKILTKHATIDPYYFKQKNNSSVLIYSPIVTYNTEEVWATLIDNPEPLSMDIKSLFNLYKMVNGECPVIRDPKGAPCGKGRFGCWICTVIRKDKASKGLIDEGYKELIPLLDFRSWLMLIRDNPEYRCSQRRNGQPGLGPFTLRARKLILKKLIAAEEKSGISLICQDEIEHIYRLWKLDRASKF